MIKSTFFWLAAVCFNLVPVLVIDIAQHRIDWQQEVREEVIIVVQNMYPFSREQKAGILDKVFERNDKLNFFIYVKGFACIILVVAGFRFFRVYQRQERPALWKPAVCTAVLMVSICTIKVFVVNQPGSNTNIQFLKMKPGEAYLESLYHQYSEGKVLYVDFWGTTCGPCLQEFRNFTMPLKDRYKQRHDIAYLYIAQGSLYMWKEQVKKYNVEGMHTFVNERQYEQLYRHSTKDSTGLVLMPRYVIFNKKGDIVETRASQPSNATALYAQLDRYLNQ